METQIKRKAGLTILISDKVDILTSNIIIDIEGYNIMIKSWIHKESLIIQNVYSPNNSTSKYMKQKLKELKGKIDKSTTIVG